jgi:hypothetical protein
MVFAVGCGGENPQVITEASRSKLAEIDKYTTHWNETSLDWIELVQRPDKAEGTLRREWARLGKDLNKDVLGIISNSAAVTQEPLAGYLKEISDVYSRQFEIMSDVVSDLQAGEAEKANKALLRLRKVAQSKIGIAGNMMDSYPSLAEETANRLGGINPDATEQAEEMLNDWLGGLARVGKLADDSAADTPSEARSMLRALSPLLSAREDAEALAATTPEDWDDALVDAGKALTRWAKLFYIDEPLSMKEQLRREFTVDRAAKSMRAKIGDALEALGFERPEGFEASLSDD